jgi:transposase InsO family protein
MDKCGPQIGDTYHVKGLGRKVRQYISCRDTCQRVKHPNRRILPSNVVQRRQNLLLCATDLFGRLLSSRGGVKYILVCLDVLSKYIKLYPLKSATTRACMNKLMNHYFNNITQPEVILSDQGTQFTSPSWKRNKAAHGVKVRYSAVRHPQSNPSERFMREIAKFCKICCHENHRKWAELVPYIEVDKRCCSYLHRIRTCRTHDER